jgi:hypothetical protein
MKQLSNFNYPLFGIRAYTRIYEEYPYKLIQTKESTYVLDIVNSSLPFVERRKKLLTSDSGYSIYNLKERFTSLAQVLNSSKRTFIDNNGKVVKITRENVYKTKVSKVLGYDATYDGKFLLFTLRDSFLCSVLYNFVVTINFNGADILVGGVDDPKTARRNYKI